MKLENGEIITLDNDKDYIVLKQLETENINYIYLVTAQKPVEVLIARIDEDILNPVTNEEELQKVINLLVEKN